GRVGLFDAHVNVATDETETGVAHHGAGKQAGFAEDLESIADAEDHAAGVGELFNGLHDGRKARNGAGTQIVAVGEAAGQNDCSPVGEIFGLVPDDLDGLLQNLADGVEGVVIAIRAGKDYDSEFHRVVTPRGIRGSSSLTHASVGSLPLRQRLSSGWFGS